MTDIEDGIQKLTAGLQAANTGDHNIGREAAFRQLRAHVRGVVIDAHRALTGRNGAWIEADDRFIDVVSSYLEDVRDRR